MRRSSDVCTRRTRCRPRLSAAFVAPLCLFAAAGSFAPPSAFSAESEPDAAAALERLQRDYLALARVASSTAAELARLKEDLRRTDAARATAERDRERLSADLVRSREELRQALDAAGKAQNEVNALLDDKIRLQNEMADQTKALRDLQRRLERLEKQSGEAESLRKTLDELRRERDRWMRERADLERRLARAEGGGATVDPRRSAASAPASTFDPRDRAEIERLRRALEEDRAAFGAERNLLEAQLTELIESREQEREAHLRESAKLQRALEALRARLEATTPAALTRTAEPPPPTATAAEKAQPGELERLQSEIESANRQRETMEREIARLTDHAIALERRIADLETLAARAAEAEALARAAGEAQRDLAKARERMAALDALVATLRSAAPAPR